MTFDRDYFFLIAQVYTFVSYRKRLLINDSQFQAKEKRKTTETDSERLFRRTK